MVGTVIIFERKNVLPADTLILRLRSLTGNGKLLIGIERNKIMEKQIAKSVSKCKIKLDKIIIEIRELTGQLIRKILIFDMKKSVGRIVKDMNEIYSKLHRTKEKLIRNMNQFEKLKKYDGDYDISSIEIDTKTIRCIGKIDNLFNIIYDILEVIKEIKDATPKELAKIKRLEEKLERE